VSFDVYVERPQGDAATQVRLLTCNGSPLPKYLQLVHGRWDKSTRHLQRGAFNQFIGTQLDSMSSLELATPDVQLAIMPIGSWFLQFTFTLAKPWMSKDDDPFYVAESVNPVRKDKVFKVPTMSAASWKGLLRWTAMHLRLALKKDELNDEDFATERFRQTLLFGDEKGEEPGQTKDFAAYLDSLKPSATDLYRRKVKECFLGDPNAKDMPHHSGRLSFYPTFFDLIDVEVINPHSRKTKAGRHPIYLECVPAGAKGAFSLLYVPLDLMDRPEEEVRNQAKEDWGLVAQCVSAMTLTYGFSAKRTSGYGTAHDDIRNGVLRTQANHRGQPLTRLSGFSDEVKNVRF
jgi:CRISPR-associated protein Cmr2